MWVGLLTDRIDNKLERSNLINEHVLNHEPVPSLCKLSQYYYIVVGHIKVVAALLGFLVRKSMDMLPCDYYNQGHLDKVDQSDYCQS